jgi:hypothetical protein
MYKRALDKIKAYSPIVVSLVCVGMFTLKDSLTEFINRPDLTECIQNHRSWVNVAIYLNVAILAISVSCMIMYFILISWLRKNK